MVKLTEPIVFTAVGCKQAGKSTVLSFLAEVLFDAGYFELKYASCVDVALEIMSRKELPSLTKHPIILIPDIKDQRDFDKIKDKAIIIYVGRSEYYADVSHPKISKSYYPDESEKWIGYVHCDYHINNDNSMRVLKWLVKDLFYREIINNKKWTKANENKT